MQTDQCEAYIVSKDLRENTYERRENGQNSERYFERLSAERSAQNSVRLAVNSVAEI